MRQGNTGEPVPKRRLRLPIPHTFDSLRHPNFRLLWITSLINAASNWIQQVTLGWLAYEITDSALVAALTFGIRSLPQLLIGPIGGVLGDRFERKRGVQINSAYMAILALAFALLVLAGRVEAWHILLFSFLQGVGQSIVGPTRQALVSNTVPREDLMNAIALNSLAQTTMRVAGPAIGGGLIALSGPALNFGIQSGGYVITFLLMVPLKAPYSTLSLRRSSVSLRESFVEGLSYVRQSRTLLGLMALALVPTVFTTPINLGLLPVYAHDQLHIHAGGLGLLYSAQGVGAVIGSLSLASLGNSGRKGLIMSGAAVSLAVAVTLYAVVTDFFVALPLAALATGSFTTYSTTNQTIIQTITPDHFRGRVMGLLMVNNGLTPFGTFAFGVIAEVYGIQGAIIIAGVCALVSVTLILTRFPSIHSFRFTPDEIAGEPDSGAVSGGTAGALP
jgi:MFS family permease